MSSTKPIIAVVTGTGAQGRSVARAFNQSGQWSVRVLTRNKKGPVAQTMAGEGIEVVEANFEDKEALLSAFRGAYAVFSCTIPNWHKSYNNKLNEYEQGVLQADVAKKANVQLFLFSTLPFVGPEYMGLGGVELYDSKALTNDYITSIGLPAVYIGTPAFIDNVSTWPLVKWAEDKSKLEFWHYVLKMESPVAFLWVERDLGPSMLALAESFRKSGKPPSEHPMNHTIQPLASWRGTWGQVSREIGTQTKIPTQHTLVPTVDERWHKDLTKAFIYQDNHGLYPTIEFPAKTFTDLGVQYGTLEEFVRVKIVPLFKTSA